MLKEYFNKKTIKFWILFTIADVIVLLVGFYLFGYFYFTAETSFKFH